MLNTEIAQAEAEFKTVQEQLIAIQEQKAKATQDQMRIITTGQAEKNLSNANAQLNNVSTATTNSIDSVINQLKSVLGSAGDAVNSALAQLRAFFDQFKPENIPSTIQSVIDTAKNQMLGIKTETENSLKGMLDNLVTQMATTMTNAQTSATDWLKQQYETYISPLFDQLKGVLDNQIKPAISSIGDFLNALPGNVSTLFSNVGKGIGDFFSNLKVDFSNAFSNFINPVKDFFSNFDFFTAFGLGAFLDLFTSGFNLLNTLFSFDPAACAKAFIDAQNVAASMFPAKG
jgi:phage-related protein